jgi:hypothetical protein
LLSFDTALTSGLASANTTAFWVLKLYYNDESDFIGVSDRHRQDGTDIYYGIVASFGTYTQSLDFFNFSTSIGNMNVNLINTAKSIKGGRFSDLIASNNFANRKWELFLNTNNTTTLDTAARRIGVGVISGEVSYDQNNFKLTLLDNSSILHKRIPANIVDSTNYPNAPSNNIGKPIPLSYGDFYEKTDIGTIPTSHFDRYSNFYKGAFPAIITDKWDVGESASEAKPDSQALNTLDSENLYFYKDGYYPTFTGTCDATTNNPVMEFSGGTASVYIPLSSSGQGSGTITNSGSVTNPLNAVDGSFSTLTAIAANGATTADSRASISYAIPKVNKLGDFTGISSLVKWGTVTSLTDTADDFFQLAGVVTLPSITSDSEVKYNIEGMFTAAQEESFDFEKNISFKLFTGNTNESVQIEETGVVIDFNIESIDSHSIEEFFEKTYTGGYGVTTQFETESEKIEETVTLSRTVNLLTPNKLDYIYYSGKGRQYGAYIDADSRDQGYAVNAVIENPIFIIESILRSELGPIYTGSGTSTTSNKLVDSNASFATSVVGQTVYNIKDKTSAMVTARDSATTLSISANIMASGEGYIVSGLTSSQIDYELFDASGDTSSGLLGDIYEDAVSDVKFAFSQYKFINSKDMIERLGRLCFSYIFLSSDGRFKIKTLRRTDDYSSSDQTVDYSDVELNKVGKTSLSAVKNSVLVKYNHSYGANQNLSEATATDSTSQGTTVNGFNQTMEFQIDANEILDSTTATKLAEAYINIMKSRKDVIEFNCIRPKYNHLEIGDIIDFSNWDSQVEIYGAAMSGYFIVASIGKSITGCQIKAIKVS